MAAIYYTHVDRETSKKTERIIANKIRSDIAKRRIAGIKSWHRQIEEWCGKSDTPPTRKFYIGKNKKEL
jgi:hypothetical protein